MRVLVTGAHGFVGSGIVAALLEAGHQVTCAVRRPAREARVPGTRELACDMARDTQASDWMPRLAGTDAVVNCAGILRERGADRFETVHVRSPMALFRACAQAGIRRVVQISAIGDPRDTEFVASKHRCDQALQALDLDAFILRPSVVCSARGSYGGTSLLRAMAALPGVIAVPGKGRQPLQPIAAEDVGRAVATALDASTEHAGVIELVGPEVVGLLDYLKAWRRWMGLPRARWILRVPSVLVRASAMLGEVFGIGPLCRTTRRMLERGNVGGTAALESMRARLDLVPRGLAQTLAATPALAQDRWHARLYLVLPILRILLALVWIGSGVLGLLLPAAAMAQATPGMLPLHVSVLLARIFGAFDLLLGVLVLLRWKPRWVYVAMLASAFGYTVVIGALWPAHWLDPFGGLLKNLALLGALLVLLACEERR